MSKLFDNTLFTSFDYFILVMLNLLATPILITHFGVEGYGAFVFLSIFSIYGAFSFFDLGMEGSLMNYVARFEVQRDRRKLQDTLSISVLYYALLGGILGLILFSSAGFVASRLLDNDSRLSYSTVLTSIDYIAINTFLQFLTIPFTAILQGMRRFVITKSLNTVMNILRYLLVIAAAVLFHRIDFAFLIILGLTLIRLALLVLVTAAKIPAFRRMTIRFDPSLMRTLIGYSSILFMSRLVGLIWNQIDKVLIWLYLAVASMTVYDVVVRPASLLRLVMSILNAAVVPEVARLHETGDIAAVRDLFIRLIRYAYLILLPVLALLYAFIDSLLQLWVGRMFVPQAHLAMILLSVYLILPIPSIASTMLIGLERVRQTIWIPITATVINIIFSLLLLRPLGLAGLLIATLAGECFALIPYYVAMKRFLLFRVGDILRPLWRIALVAAGAAAVYFATRHFLPVQDFVTAVTAAVVFCLNLYINCAFLLDSNEKNFVKARFKAAVNRLA